MATCAQSADVRDFRRSTRTLATQSFPYTCEGANKLLIRILTLRQWKMAFVWCEFRSFLLKREFATGPIDKWLDGQQEWTRKWERIHYDFRAVSLSVNSISRWLSMLLSMLLSMYLVRASGVKCVLSKSQTNKKKKKSEAKSKREQGNRDK